MKVTVDLKFKKGDVVWGFYCDGEESGHWCVYRDVVAWVQFDEEDNKKIVYGLDGLGDTVPGEELFNTPREACYAMANKIEIGA